MKTIKMTVEFTYDEQLMHSGDECAESKEWFYEDILKNRIDGGKLILHSNEIGDEIGDIKVLSISQ